MYTENDLVRIAKRENNKKRNYLVVNQIQGKHVPVLPSKALAMFEELAKLLKKEYFNERLLLIGFAETATGIGASVAIHLDCYYIQTTREQIDDVEYLYFSETHSHATEQKLVKDDIDTIINKIDRIVFIEDEITTGNTIMNIIDIIEKNYSQNIKFSVASLLNGMNPEAEKKYNLKAIKTHYLVKTNHEQYIKKAEQYKADGTYYISSGIEEKEQIVNHNIICTGYVNARRVIYSKEYNKACIKLWEEIEDKLALQEERILVLGTEEFMYPALYIAMQIEQKKHAHESVVRFHATTRSPIVVSTEDEYPLHIRYELKSLYDRNRITYIYDLQFYDRVLIITDALMSDKEGLNSLISALRQSGSSNIDVVRWCQ